MCAHVCVCTRRGRCTDILYRCFPPDSERTEVVNVRYFSFGKRLFVETLSVSVALRPNLCNFPNDIDNGRFGKTRRDDYDMV